MQPEAASTLPMNRNGDYPDAAQQEANLLLSAGRAQAEAVIKGLANSRTILETLDVLQRSIADFGAKLDRVAAAIAEQPARPIEAAAAPAPTLPELLDKLEVARICKCSTRTVGRMLAHKEMPAPERLEPSPERKKELAAKREQQRQLNGEAPKGKPKGRGLGKAVWRREIIEQWLAEGRPPAEFFKPKIGARNHAATRENL